MSPTVKKRGIRSGAEGRQMEYSVEDEKSKAAADPWQLAGRRRQGRAGLPSLPFLGLGSSVPGWQRCRTSPLLLLHEEVTDKETAIEVTESVMRPVLMRFSQGRNESGFTSRRCSRHRSCRAGTCRSSWEPKKKSDLLACRGNDPGKRKGARTWFQNYDDIQTCAIVLLYLQVLCSLIGSLGASYTGVLVANFALALFALIAIESGSQTLGRAYAGLLALAVVIDIVWFILFTREIRQKEEGSTFGRFSIFSLKLVFWMQVIGFTLRFLSGFLWLQMYRLGVAADNSAMYQPVDFDGRIATFGLTQHEAASSSFSAAASDEVLGGSIYNPAAYARLLNQFADEPYFTTEGHKESEVFNGADSVQYQPPDIVVTHKLGKQSKKSMGVT
ncbi:hypothetical protein R1flu_019107 [Riccia fluitans]|uniref:Uncharacterized protein n=1 Tax=Riccia fluitans TaxID=41844 RepID=A0ABD1ZL58_9MARC